LIEYVRALAARSALDAGIEAATSGAMVTAFVPAVTAPNQIQTTYPSRINRKLNKNLIIGHGHLWDMS